ncbi:hypothetical protein Pmar_PMAR019080 [Perkinsus marinus ATCC 50983]|uniref:Uncharacterized protein n=1 Tax=Perkinsus marinus (strain ATCC 50983 / TXsc) TaxID=423536 RepID=C5KTT6_PERM5|nr:hypothetical protein Pmar_PMAR019080 [Perkinsus marinus ATCC 50983]EER11978.1 hypothetical protein Pmar_PMAR019080 [Perkinsus marinus ATCC 50983]|eukprot:XP_002780183.1 hypothetical protein Pmar_PMAR019080 [Perkinsus marinus ATCC 50983]
MRFTVLILAAIVMAASAIVDSPPQDEPKLDGTNCVCSSHGFTGLMLLVPLVSLEC